MLSNPAPTVGGTPLHDEISLSLRGNFVKGRLLEDRQEWGPERVGKVGRITRETNTDFAAQTASRFSYIDSQPTDNGHQLRRYLSFGLFVCQHAHGSHLRP